MSSSSRGVCSGEPSDLRLQTSILNTSGPDATRQSCANDATPLSGPITVDETDHSIPRQPMLEKAKTTTRTLVSHPKTLAGDVGVHVVTIAVTVADTTKLSEHREISSDVVDVYRTCNIML